MASSPIPGSSQGASTPPAHIPSYTAPRFVSHNSPLRPRSPRSSHESINPDDAMDVDDSSRPSPPPNGHAMDVDNSGDPQEREDDELDEGDGNNNVDQDIDELLSSSDERPPLAESSRSGAASKSRSRPAKKKPETEEVVEEKEPDWGCKWEGCDEVPENQEGLIEHIQKHVNDQDETYTCEWFKCPRKSQKQSGKSGLFTHVRIHTGEKPYKCSHEGCGKAFTRNDAMNKHMRTFHAAEHEAKKAQVAAQAAAKKASKANSSAAAKQVDNPASTPGGSSRKPANGTGAITTPTKAPLVGGTPISLKAARGAAQAWREQQLIDRELVEDPDLTDVIPRIRARKQFWTVTEDDERLIADIRARFSRRGPGNDEGSGDDGEDIFDEGVSKGFPVEPTVEGIVEGGPPGEDARNGTTGASGQTVHVMNRPQWMIKYIVAKAKLMLVEEENAMRKTQLMELMDKEAQLLAESET